MSENSREEPAETSEVLVEESFFRNTAGQNICHCRWISSRKTSESNTAVFIVHGVGEHLRAYDRMAKILARKGFLVFAHDHVGHGKSEGDRVHITKCDTYVNDTVQHVTLIKEEMPQLTCYLIGHSLGGAIALMTMLDHGALFAGAVLIGPAIVPDKDTATPFKIFMAKLISHIYPQYQVGSIQPEFISRDPDIVKAYKEDPLTWHGGLKAKFCVCLLDALSEIKSRFEAITFPYFILHGSDDKLCSLEGSQLLYQHSPSTDKLLKIYPGAYHQVHNEPNGQGDAAVQDIVDWLSRL